MPGQDREDGGAATLERLGSARKTESYHLRHAPEDRRLWERGAEARGVPLAAFLRRAARRAARDAILRDAMESPPPEDGTRDDDHQRED